MPTSPLSLQRNKPTLAQIIKLIDRALIMSGRTTLSTATSLIVDAPFGYLEYVDDIRDTYVNAGWIHVEFLHGKSSLQDKLQFFSTEYTPPATVTPSPVVSISAENYTVLEDGHVLLGVAANPVDVNTPITQVEIYNGELLLYSTSQQSFSYTWANVQSGVYSLTARVTDSKGYVGISMPIVINVIL